MGQYEKADQSIDNAGGGAYGSQSLCPHKVADNQAVNGIVKLLKQIAKKKREGEGKQKAGNGTGCHIHCL